MVYSKNVVKQFLASQKTSAYDDIKHLDQKVTKVLPLLMSGVQEKVCNPTREEKETIESVLAVFNARWSGQMQASKKMAVGWKSQADTVEAWIKNPEVFCKDPKKMNELRDASIAMDSAWKEYVGKARTNK